MLTLSCSYLISFLPCPLPFLALDLKSGLAYEGKPKGGQPALTTYLVEAHDLVALLNGKLNTAHVRMMHLLSSFSLTGTLFLLP